MGYRGTQLFRNVARAVQLRGLSDGICPHVRVTHANRGKTPPQVQSSVTLGQIEKHVSASSST
jgi:hypothetical protein